MRTRKNGEIETLTFIRHEEMAQICTNGRLTRSYRPNECKAHKSLKAAIAYLEAQGFDIQTDTFA